MKIFARNRDAVTYKTVLRPLSIHSKSGDAGTEGTYGNTKEDHGEEDENEWKVQPT